MCCRRRSDPADGIAVVRGLLRGRSETILHGAWRPCRFLEAFGRVLARRPYLKMPHGSYDPVRLAYHGWKKRLAGPFERWTLRHAASVLVTCPDEESWVRAYEPRVRSVETVDLKAFFDLSGASAPARTGSPACHVLYLGRLHPLKGVGLLERAVREVNEEGTAKSERPAVELRIVSDHAGAELERDWAWCDVLCLPTLSENFGLVVAEALAHGRRVIVTDGAPAWDPSASGTDYGGRLVYLEKYREAPDDASRVALLRAALSAFQRYSTFA